MSTLRERQIASLKQMLHFNQIVTKGSLAEPQWKVLVYDRCGQDIISPLISIGELRDMGVTLYLLLHSDREVIPDVPAIYFVLPTQENIQRICQDFSAQLYESFYLNFVSPIPRQRLEDLASAAIHSNCVSNIPKIFDQYLNFVTLDSDLFVIRPPEQDLVSYYAINRGDVKDTEISAMMDSIADSLLSVFATLGVVPIIRCPANTAAEMVAEKLDKRLRENIRDTRNSLFTADSVSTGQYSFQRPLLVILDRNMDLATPFHHTWTYQALLHDVLEYRLNRVSISDAGDSNALAPTSRSVKKKSYDISPTDSLWMQLRGSPFPTVAETVQEELDSFRAQEGEVKRLKAAMGLEGEDDSAIAMLADNTAKLSTTVSSLPELLEKKRVLDIHMNVATAVLEEINARKLDTYFEIEEKLMSKLTPDRSLMEVIMDPEAGTPDDRVRLFIIALICGPALSETETEEYCSALREVGCDTSALRYIRRHLTISRSMTPAQSYGGGGTRTVSMFPKLMNHASQFLMEGVKNLVVKKHNLPFTRIVDALMTMKSLTDTDNYRYFDSKLLRHDSSLPRNKSPFSDAFVFVVGGGNYIEYQNLVDYVKSKGGQGVKSIVYGCTELVNAGQLLKQLHRLGDEIS